jgi:hypothetical protein
MTISKGSRRARTLGAVFVATVAVTSSIAVAQGGGAPDGTPSSAAEAPEPAAAVAVTCGARIQSLVRTENAASTTSSTTFVNVPGGSATVTVPSGASRCLKVLLTAETACSETSAGDFCYVRVLDNGVEMSPQGAQFQAIDSEKSTARGHAFEWAKRLAAGNHSIVLQRRVGNSATVFTMDDWTFDVQLDG